MLNMLEIFLLDEILKILPGKPHSLDSSDVIKEINKKKKKKKEWKLLKLSWQYCEFSIYLSDFLYK